MTTLYTITSTSGIHFGTHMADTPAQALLAIHRAAGYGEHVVWLSTDGVLSFATDHHRHLLGDVEDWDITAAP